MKRLLIIFGLLMLVVTGCGETTDKPAANSQVELAKVGDVTLHTNKQEDNSKFKGITVQIRDKSKTFPWVNVKIPFYYPAVKIADVNADGKEEIVVILTTTGAGTGTHLQEIHVLNLEDLTEITPGVENPHDVIEKKVHSKITKHNDKIDVVVEYDGKKIEKTYDESDTEAWNTENVFGETQIYKLHNNKIYAIMPGSVSEHLIAQAIVEYGPDLQAKNITVKAMNNIIANKPAANSQVELAKVGDVTLLTNTQEENGMFQGITVRTKNKSKTFPWTNETNPTFYPKVKIEDVDVDGKEEIVVILELGHGTGCHEQEIHVLNIEDLTEITPGVENPLEVIEKKVHSKITKNNGKVNMVVEWDGNKVEKTYDESYAIVWNDAGVGFGSIVKYKLYNNKIYAIVPGSVSMAAFGIVAIVEYDPDLKASNIMVKDIDEFIDYPDVDDLIFYPDVIEK